MPITLQRGEFCKGAGCLEVASLAPEGAAREVRGAAWSCGWGGPTLLWLPPGCNSLRSRITWCPYLPERFGYETFPAPRALSLQRVQLTLAWGAEDRSCFSLLHAELWAQTRLGSSQIVLPRQTCLSNTALAFWVCWCDASV